MDAIIGQKTKKGSNTCVFKLFSPFLSPANDYSAISRVIGPTSTPKTTIATARTTSGTVM